MSSLAARFVSKTKYVSERPYNVPRGGQYGDRHTRLVIPKGCRLIKSICFSASGGAKFCIYRNEELVATLFNSITVKNVLYNLPISLSSKDTILLTYENMDLAAFDMYATVEFEEKRK